MRNDSPRRLARLVLLAAALLIAAPPVPAAGESGSGPFAAPQCTPDGLGAGEDGGSKLFPTVDTSIPGWWRQELKSEDVPRRDPGTLAIQPRNPAPAEVSTDGRWLEGYRPATPQAAAALDAWKAGQNSAKAGAVGADTPRSTSSNYAANLMTGERVAEVPEEPITRVVRDEEYPIYRIDLRQLTEVSEEKPKPAGPPSDYHHGSSMTWNEYLLVKQLAKTSPATVDGQENAGEGLRAPQPGGVSFDALQSTGAIVPPDPIMAAGPSHLVAVVNTRYQVWDKSGTPLIADITLDTFFAGVPNCQGAFDVFVDYDEAADRFVMGGEALTQSGGVDSYLCVAATVTNDPTGAWNRASFRADAVSIETWIDYPHMGIGLDAIYIAGNMFTDDTSSFNHIRAFAVDKYDLYGGTPVSVAEASLGGLFFTAQPVKLHGFTSGGWPAPGTPHYFVSHDAGGNSRVWRWGDPFVSDPVIYGTIAEENFHGVPPDAPELGGTLGDLNDTGSAKWMDAEYRDGKLWTARNVACNIGGGAAESCIDWIQVDVSGPSPVLDQQQTGGAYGSAGDFRYYPDLAVDRNNNIAIGYTKSSETTYTEVWVTGREFGDTAGELQSETLQRAGLGNYFDGSGCQGTCDRWGDYTGLTVDPDGCTFWYLGQYSDGGYFDWGTHIGSFKFSSCSIDSSLQVDKGTYTCDDTITIDVSDATPIDAATVAAQTTVSTSGGDSETIPAGAWTGSNCAGNDCGSWTATLPTSGEPGSIDDGTLNVNDAETITVEYADPHTGHGDQTRNVTAACSTRLEDGGYITVGGCEAGKGTELYRDYMDGGEYISYAFGIFNPQTAPALTDVETTLTISGAAADKVVIFNPTIYIGSMDRGALTGPVFQLYIDPSIDDAAFRLSDHDFNLEITSRADGYPTAQLLTQSHLLQTDDNIVTESECWNFESGNQGFVQQRYVSSYDCNPADGCDGYLTIDTVSSPWTHGEGCGSETRDDHPEMTCDTAGTSAFMTNNDPAACNTFAESTTTLVDDLLFSPVFTPTYTGSAANGQPWFYKWLGAEWFYRSDMVSGIDPAMAVGFFWDDDYAGASTPSVNETGLYYNYLFGYHYYDNQGWDSSTPWDPNQTPANHDAVSFGDSVGEATPGLKWRWAVEVYDTDYGGDPTATPPTQGLALDDLDMSYHQYHAEGQVGTCLDPPAVVSIDQFTYLVCPEGGIGVSVLDGNAAGSVRVTVESWETGDSETFAIYGSTPYFATSLPYSTGDGSRENDGTLFVAASDQIRATYEDGPTTTYAYTVLDCQGGDVVTEGVTALSDNGDGDSFADTNETVDISIRIRNNSGQTLQNVTATIVSDDPMIDCITKDQASFGTIPASGGSATNDLLSDPFTFKVSYQAECADPATPPTARIQVLIRADGFAGPLAPQAFTMFLDMDDVPGVITFNEDFTTEPAGFQHRLGPGDDDGVSIGPGGLSCSPYVDEFFWRATGGNSGGGYFVWQDPADEFPNGTYSDLNDSALFSRVFKIASNSTMLGFDHEYQFGWQSTYRVDGARVDYSVNGGPWQKVNTLPYDGALIWNSYCNPLCNAQEFGLPCFTESTGDGEHIFNQLDQGTVPWTTVNGEVTGLNAGDLVQFRWRVGSMNTSVYGISTLGGYGLDNLSVTNVIEQICDTAANPDTGCGVVFESSGNLVQICGDDDALVEPTERWSVDTTLRNSSAGDAVNTVADLAVNSGSAVLAAVMGSPGSFGTLASEGGTGTATYEFTVDPAAGCVRDITFDVENIADDGAFHADQPSAFTVQVGGVGAQEVASQSVSPLGVADDTASSTLLPAFTTPAPAFSATVDFDHVYTNTTPVQAETQDTDPLVAENGSTETLLGQLFTIPSNEAVSAVVDWTTLDHERVTQCTRVFLRMPSGFAITLKAIDSPPANPYDVMTWYRHANGGPGQYSIGIEEVASGPCKNTASLSGATMTVTGQASAGSWTANARVSLWDGSSEYILKNFGAADAAPYDVTSIYNTAGPGSYTLRLEESGAGGTAEVSAGTMTVDGIECDLGCADYVPPPPPLADGIDGSPMLMKPGSGPNELEFTIDNATCSSSRAVVVYGNIGDYGGYQGAVDAGCDLGSGPTATVTHAGDNVWFNVIWVNDDGAGGHPGYDFAGSRTWNAVGLCGVALDDTSDAVCD